MLTPDFLAQLVVNGVVTGSVYVLVAMGLTLIFGILGVINFAHGEFYVFGGYFGITASVFLGTPLFLTLAIGMVGVIVLAMLSERIVFRPLRGRDVTSSIIASFGLAVVLQNVALLAFGPQPKLLRTEWASIPVTFAGLFLTLQRAIIPVVAAVFVIAFHLMLKYTWTGRSLRAMAEQPTVARLCGVDIDRVGLATFAVAGALAGGAGILMASTFMIQPAVGEMIALKAFTVVILGGMGNIYGAVAAGLLLGITESFTAGLVSNTLRDIVGFVMVILVLLLRPQGIFGRSLDRA